MPPVQIVKQIFSQGREQEWRLGGEGDEILYIDGKRAIQGTGSEDYFCESYGLSPGCFPYYGVTICEGPLATAYRWRARIG